VPEPPFDFRVDEHDGRATMSVKVWEGKIMVLTMTTYPLTIDAALALSRMFATAAKEASDFRERKGGG